jgi:hypothetical protein
MYANNLRCLATSGDTDTTSDDNANVAAIAIVVFAALVEWPAPDCSESSFRFVSFDQGLPYCAPSR